jgi:hypothetical protein
MPTANAEYFADFEPPIAMNYESLKIADSLDMW